MPVISQQQFKPKVRLEELLNVTTYFSSSNFSSFILYKISFKKKKVHLFLVFILF